MLVKTWRLLSSMSIARRSRSDRRTQSVPRRRFRLLAAAALAVATAATEAQPLLRPGGRHAPARASHLRPERRAGRARAGGRRPGFLDEQFAVPPSQYPASPTCRPAAATYCPTDPNPFSASATTTRCSSCRTDFFRNALAGNDQLRQRVAFALSQIFVTSGLDINVRLRDGRLPADLPRQRVRQLRGPAGQGDAVVGDGRLPQHGQQRQARRGREPERELRARAAAAVRDRRCGS